MNSVVRRRWLYDSLNLTCDSVVAEDKVPKISCSVDEEGRISASEPINGAKCLKYEFDLVRRRAVRDSSAGAIAFAAKAIHARAARDFFDRCAGTPQRLTEFAREGGLEKMTLVELLTPEKRRAYLDVCGIIERAIVDVCAAKGDPCLEEGCATKGETCLQACLAAGEAYHKACAATWIKLFNDPNNRIDSWKN